MLLIRWEVLTVSAFSASVLSFVIGATRLWKRVWQLYLAHVMLVVVYFATVGYLALHFGLESIAHYFNVARLADQPFETLIESLLLRFKPVNLDVLPLYIVLMAVFPPILWIMLRRPGLTILESLALYFAARKFGWNLSAYPQGSWYFNPFCWQFLFCFGAWTALGGSIQLRPIIVSRWLIPLCTVYLVFGLIMTLAGSFETIGGLIPRWMYELFNPNDKTNLAPYRVLHFSVIALLVARLIPKGCKGMEWLLWDPLVKCG